MKRITYNCKKQEYYLYYDNFEDEDFDCEVVLRDEEMDSLIISTIMDLTDEPLDSARAYVNIAKQLDVDLVEQLEEDLLIACEGEAYAKYNEWLEENHENRLRACEEELAEQRRDYYRNVL